MNQVPVNPAHPSLWNQAKQLASKEGRDKQMQYVMFLYRRLMKERGRA